MYRFPFPPFPTGWYALGRADAFRPAAVATLRRFGRDLVVFRTPSGATAVLDAICPHLGAHLGRGVVRGEELLCPFHGFGFGTDGRCASLPAAYGGRVPPRLSAGSWPAREVNGFLVVWFDPARREPAWELPERDLAGWSAVRARSYRVRTHPQETGEGSVDLGHLRSVHRYLSAEPSAPLEIDGHSLRTRYRVTRRAFPGMGGRVLTIEFAPQLHGLGFSLVDVEVASLDLRHRVWILATPIDGEHIDYTVAFSMEAPRRLGALHPLLDRLPRAAAAALVEEVTFRAFLADVELDFPIWEEKAYVHPPGLVAGDGPIGQYRRWARQFHGQAAAADAVGETA